MQRGTGVWSVPYSVLILIFVVNILLPEIFSLNRHYLSESESEETYETNNLEATGRKEEKDVEIIQKVTNKRKEKNIYGEFDPGQKMTLSN